MQNIAKLDVFKIFSYYFKNAKGIGNKTFKDLLEHFGGIDNFFEQKELGGNLEKVNSAFLFSKKKAFASDNFQFPHKIKFLWEDDYPEDLKEIYDPPAYFFYKGEYSKYIFENLITIVGTRKSTEYGTKWTREIASGLSSVGYCIVSGMAMGIDKIAHEATINSNAKTIAVLASDVSKPSPAINTKTYNRILESGGLIISEFPKGTEFNKGFFARRNRILAGLSRATIVTEASIKSGSLITANYAFDYNRDVFALPGNVDNSLSAGTNKLIQDQKAKLINSSKDILKELGHTNLQYNSNNDVILESLTRQERGIYDILLSSSKFIGEIAVSSDLTTAEIVNICTELELKGIVKKGTNGRYCIN